MYSITTSQTLKAVDIEKFLSGKWKIENLHAGGSESGMTKSGPTGENKFFAKVLP